ncbi:DOC family protein [Fusarium phyllophilum]|uniref:DOC family protein n=1 Tax=Fusarium phyllophilum TaxID=47803 RepID=A0A8H5K9X2_9HYPO|nr:DOC family protein [Fusarium phyllophilum]
MILSRSVRTSLQRVKPTLNISYRLYHNAVAKFTTIDLNGIPFSYDTGIMIGEPGENYIYIEPDIGQAIRRALVSQIKFGSATHHDTLPLQFNHRSLCFTHQSFSLPRIELQQNLGDSKQDVSSATLWLTGNWNAITLDGTPDAQILRLYETNIVRARPTQMTYLESAVFSPQQHKNYGQDDAFQLAGILAQKITLNHPFQDGNKRTALVAASMFVQLHGYQLREPFFISDEMDEKIKDAHVAVATRQWDAEKLASFYESITTSL